MNIIITISESCDCLGEGRGGEGSFGRKMFDEAPGVFSIHDLMLHLLSKHTDHGVLSRAIIVVDV